MKNDVSLAVWFSLISHFKNLLYETERNFKILSVFNIIMACVAGHRRGGKGSK